MCKKWRRIWRIYYKKGTRYTDQSDSERGKPKQWKERQTSRWGMQTDCVLKSFFQLVGILLVQVTLPEGLFSSALQNLVDLAGGERAAQTGPEGNGNSEMYGLNVILFSLKKRYLAFRN